MLIVAGIDTFKICARCDDAKSLNEFPAISAEDRVDCYRAYCYPCWNAYSRERRTNLRLSLIHHYGGKCVCCGEANPDFLEFDHINGGGLRHRRENGLVGAPFYDYLNKHKPSDIQLLCSNCNKAKGTSSECPHQKIIRKAKSGWIQRINYA